jgi:hypothetical protein
MLSRVYQESSKLFPIWTASACVIDALTRDLPTLTSRKPAEFLKLIVSSLPPGRQS